MGHKPAALVRVVWKGWGCVRCCFDQEVFTPGTWERLGGGGALGRKRPRRHRASWGRFSRSLGSPVQDPLDSGTLLGRDAQTLAWWPSCTLTASLPRRAWPRFKHGRSWGAAVGGGQPPHRAPWGSPSGSSSKAGLFPRLLVTPVFKPILASAQSWMSCWLCPGLLEFIRGLLRALRPCTAPFGEGSCCSLFLRRGA